MNPRPNPPRLAGWLNQANFLLSILLLSILTRAVMPPYLGHPPNFSPMDAIALFGGAYFRRRWIAMFMVLACVILSDIMVDKVLFGDWLLFYSGSYWQYASYAVITLLGSFLELKVKPFKLAAASITSALLFFAISNYGVWFSSMMYARTWDGLFACYLAGIPFLKNTLLSDLLFSSLLFGCFRIKTKLFPVTA